MSSDSIYNNNFDYDYNDDDDIYTFETDSTMIILGIFCFILFTLLCMHTYGLRRRQRTRINHSNHSNHSIQLNSISFNPTFVYTPEICTICLDPFTTEKDIFLVHSKFLLRGHHNQFDLSNCSSFKQP